MCLLELSSLKHHCIACRTETGGRLDFLICTRQDLRIEFSLCPLVRPVPWTLKKRELEPATPATEGIGVFKLLPFARF
jgi:hypothetical protein